MKNARMMKMATGEGFPLRHGAGTSLDWFSVATEASDSGTPDLGYFLELSVFIGIFFENTTFPNNRFMGGTRKLITKIYIKWIT